MVIHGLIALTVVRLLCVVSAGTTVVMVGMELYLTAQNVMRAHLHMNFKTKEKTMSNKTSGYCKEDNATCCADCRHYIRNSDDYDECGIDAGQPCGEWVHGKCGEFEEENLQTVLEDAGVL